MSTRYLHATFLAGVAVGVCATLFYEGITHAVAVRDCQRVGTSVEYYLTNNHNGQKKAAASLAIGWAVKGLDRSHEMLDNADMCKPYITSAQFKTMALAAKMLKERE